MCPGLLFLGVCASCVLRFFQPVTVEGVSNQCTMSQENAALWEGGGGGETRKRKFCVLRQYNFQYEVLFSVGSAGLCRLLGGRAALEKNTLYLKTHSHPLLPHGQDCSLPPPAPTPPSSVRHVSEAECAGSVKQIFSANTMSGLKRNSKYWQANKPPRLPAGNDE